MKIRLLGILPMIMLALASCDDSESTDIGDWKKTVPFPGVSRSHAISFVIDGYAYVGLGVDDDDEYLSDMYRFDPTINDWSEVASFPGTGRISAVSFVATGKGYVSTGFNGDLETEELDDLWEYDPLSDIWTEKASFPGSARYNAVAFSINDYGFVGTGYDDNYRNDFYRYDPSTDSWIKSPSMIGDKREAATAFVIDGVAYVGSGLNNGLYLYDFSAFDPELGWNILTLDEDDDDTYDEFVAAMNRYDATSFVVDGTAYVGLGISGSGYSSVIFSYDPTTNEWEELDTRFEGTSRANTVSFVLNGIPYVTTGGNASNFFDDLWAFYLDEEYDDSIY